MNNVSRQQGLKVLGEVWRAFCEQILEDTKIEDLLPEVEAARRAHQRLMERVQRVCGPQCQYGRCDCFECVDHWRDYCVKVGQPCDLRGRKDLLDGAR